MNERELEFEIIPSPHDPSLGVSVGVLVKYGSTNITAKSTSKKTQYANKVQAIEKLKVLLLKERFHNIDEADLIDCNTFLNNMD